MSRGTRLVTSALAAAAAGLFASGAEAGGFTYRVTPDRDSGRVIGAGLEIYSLYKQQRNAAKVRQRGDGNGAAIAQSGSSNSAFVYQRGRGHSATLEQNGNRNALGVFQFGRGARTSVSQNGDGRADFIFQGGW